jgi:hypothetical protein
MQQNISLDDTLRFLYSTCRLKRCKLMAIEFKHRAKTYRADTPEEAARLVKLLREADHQEGIYADDDYTENGEPIYQKVWDLDTFMQLMENLGDLQKLFLKSLVGESQVHSATILADMGLDSEVALAGVLSGLSKQLKHMNLSSGDLYLIKVKWEGKQKKRLFTMNQDFMSAALEAGWPDEWKGIKNAASTKTKRK